LQGYYRVLKYRIEYTLNGKDCKKFTFFVFFFCIVFYSDKRDCYALLSLSSSTKINLYLKDTLKTLLSWNIRKNHWTILPVFYEVLYMHGLWN